MYFLTGRYRLICEFGKVKECYNQDAIAQLNLPGGTQFDFIEEDLKQVLPSAVSRHSNWFAAGKNNQRALIIPQVTLEKLVPLLVGAVKEQQVEIETLKLELQQLRLRAK